MKMLFEIATREKYRFPSLKGKLTVEDLWDLPLTSRNGVNLDAIAQEINTRVKESANESFVIKATKPNQRLKNKLEILKHIIEYRLNEKDQVEKNYLKKQQKEKIMGLIEEKKDQDLKNASIEDLQKMLAEI
jgi:hypothetical protein